MRGAGSYACGGQEVLQQAGDFGSMNQSQVEPGRTLL